MFDSRIEYEVKVLSGGIKKCVLRFPTDEQFIARTRAQRTIRRESGGVVTSEVPNAHRANLELLERIRIDKDGDSFDEFEATKAIERIERIEIVDCDRVGEEFAVKMRVPGGEVVHRLCVPTQADIVAYSRGSVHRRDQRRESVTVIDLTPAGVLWAKITRGVEGYADGSAVPITHKDAAIVEMLAEMEQVLRDDQDPEA